MAAGDPILDVSDLIYLATGGGGGTPEQINWFKSGLKAGAAPTAPVAGRLHDLWMWDGQPGGASTTAPTTATALSNATSGSFQQGTPATGARKRLLGVVGQTLTPGTLILYDRLNQQGGLSGASNTAQTTNLPTTTLTRRTSGVGVEAWWRVYTAIGTTASTATISYTNHAGTSGQTSRATTIGATGLNAADRVVPLALAVGDRGVRAVASVTLSASTGTAGACGIVLSYPYVTLPMALVGVGTLWSSFLLPGGPVDCEVNAGPCFTFVWYAQTTTAPSLFGQTYFIEK